LLFRIDSKDESTLKLAPHPVGVGNQFKANEISDINCSYESNTDTRLGVDRRDYAATSPSLLFGV